MLFIPLFIYMLLSENGRKQFKNKGLYFAVIISFLIFLPHFVWLIKNDFFSLNYFIMCEERYSTFYHGSFKYIYAPFMFLFNQFLALSGTLFIYFSAKFLFKGKEECSNNADDKMFLICSGVAPLCLQTLSSISGSYAVPQWGYVTLFMCGILMFYFFPFKITDKVAKYIVYWSFAAMIITMIILSIVFMTEKNFANRFPVQQVTDKLNSIYNSETGQDIKYLGGFIELTIPLQIYNNKYTVILDTYEYPNVWISQENLRKNGAMIIGRNEKLMDYYIENSVPNLKSKPAVKHFCFTVKNAIGREREYSMFYAIIPPNAEYIK